MKFSESKYRNEVISTSIFDFGQLYYLDSIMIAEIFDGVVIDTPEIRQIKNDSLKRFSKKQSFIYISNRFNQYSSNPNSFYEFRNLTKLKQVILVPYNQLSHSTAKFESHFLDAKSTIITNLDNAIIEAKKILATTQNPSKIIS